MRAKIFAILPIFVILLSSTVVPYSFASVESEAQEDIQAGCRDGQTMVFRFAYNEYVCVSPDTAERWRELGLAKIILESDKIEKDIPVKETAETVIPVTETVENNEFPGAPPEPPKKSTSIDNSECRDGYTLVYRFVHHDSFCTSPSTASSWERLGLAEIVKPDMPLDEEVEGNENIIDNTPNEIDLISESNNEEEQYSGNEEEQYSGNEEEQYSGNEEEQYSGNEEEQYSGNEEEQYSDDVSFESPVLDSSNSIQTPGIHPLNDRIWIAVGYDYTNSMLIEGDKGIIVIDTLSYESSKKVLEEFRTITDKPVKTIIYTKINPTLVEGSKAFLEEGDGNVEIVIHEELLQNYNNLYNLDALTTHTYSSEFSLDISGVEMKLYRIEGEHSDQTYILLPVDEGVLIGDSVYGISPFLLELDYFQNFLD